MWLFEKLLLHNNLFGNTILSSSASFRTKFIEVKVIELGHVVKALVGRLGGLQIIRSSSVLRKNTDEVWEKLSLAQSGSVTRMAAQWTDGADREFPREGV